MFIQILIGTAMIIMTVVLQILFTSTATLLLYKKEGWFIKPPLFFKAAISMILVVLWLVVGISLSAWLWAGIFLVLDIFRSLEPAFYFSIVTFTTLGYGDIIVVPEWRILASFVAVDGLIIFGLNAAYLVEFTNRLNSAQDDIRMPPPG